jgi:NitT/TauT family transport system substrate-binding protein
MSLRSLVSVRQLLTVVAAVALTVALPRLAAAADGLKIAYSDWPGWVAFEVGIQKGWFKEAGVPVEFVWMEYGPSMEAFQAGKVDAVTVASGDQLVMAAAGKASKGILLTDYSNGNDQIVAKPGIASVKELKGKKIGVELGLVEHLLLFKALELNGMKESDITLVNVPTNDTPQTLASGGVDAIGAWQPNSGAALKLVAGSKAIFSSKDAPGLIYDFLAVSPESLNAHRAEWAKIVGVWPRIVAFIADPKTQPEALKIMAARVSIPAEDYAKLLPGTFLLDAAGNKKAYVKAAGLESVHGSMTVANAFNVANKVYAASVDPAALIDDSLIKALP